MLLDCDSGCTWQAASLPRRSPSTYTTPILFSYMWLVKSEKLQFGRIQLKFILEQIRVAWIQYEQLSTTWITNMTLREGLLHRTDSIEPQQGKLSLGHRLSELVSYWVSWSASTSLGSQLSKPAIKPRSQLRAVSFVSDIHLVISGITYGI